MVVTLPNGDHSKQGCTRRYFDTLCLNDLTSASQLSAIWENGVLLQHECLLTHWYVDTCVRGEKNIHHVSSLIILSGNLLHSYWKVPFSSLFYPFEMGKLSIEHWGFVIPKMPSWPLAEAPDHHSNGSPEPPPTKKTSNISNIMLKKTDNPGFIVRDIRYIIPDFYFSTCFHKKFRYPHLARAPSPAPWEAPEPATASPAAVVELPTSPRASWSRERSMGKII